MLTLVIGNKNYSSWSLRPWLALTHAGATFEEIRIPLYRPESKAAILAHSPSGKVPLLKDGPVAVWDSLAICEYVNERFPAARLWPADAAPRAEARAVSAEMHSGFANIRTDLPMNLRRAPSRPPIRPEVHAEIERVLAIWRGCRARNAGAGPFLFGAFTIADAMFAPVVTRFVSYDIAVGGLERGYMNAVLALPAMRAWTAAALAETEILW
jgi:glutathione S-transferase